MKPRGLTLLEVLVVTVIVIVVAALAFPFHTRCGRGGRQAYCKNSLKQIGVYYALYESKFKAYPPVGPDGGFSLLWRSDLVQDGNFFRCAVRGKAGAGTHYQGITLAGAWKSEDGTLYSVNVTGLDNKAPADLPVAADESRNHGDKEEINVLHFLGRVESLPLRDASAVESFLNPVTWSAPIGTR